ncbi:hypothetical protein DDI_0227 [Dickeya dianthicola RNS04.9]|nr:hypothetical protein DDI_0227 [Dickeya dianthicola RNS04.9]
MTSNVDRISGYRCAERHRFYRAEFLVNFISFFCFIFKF